MIFSLFSLKNYLYLATVYLIVLYAELHAAVIGYANQNLFNAHLIHNPNILTRIQQQNNINALGNNQTSHISFLVQANGIYTHNQNIQNTIADALTEIVAPPNQNGVRNGILPLALAGGNTAIAGYVSGTRNGDTNAHHIYNIHQNSVQYAYSRVFVGSSHGTFVINNGDHSWHTEPKSLNTALIHLDNHNATSVLIVSRRPLCRCCSRLILDILNARRLGAHNIFVMSQNEFNGWMNHPRIQQNIQNQQNRINNCQNIINRVNQAMARPGGNAAALLIRY